MKKREIYKGCHIVARSYKLPDGQFSSDFCIQEDDENGFLETEDSLPNTFPTQESAIEAAIRAGRREIDGGVGLVKLAG